MTSGFGERQRCLRLGLDAMSDGRMRPRHGHGWLPLSAEERLSRRTLGVMASTVSQVGVCNVPNRTIFEGDNLDVMRGMNDGCVDLIYLDPAFGSDWDCAVVVGCEAAGAEITGV